jgi:2-hydroxy-6-oxonona-2,4-dienedioate hydrolase
MTDHAIATPRRPSAMERYLAAETRLWQHYGLAPRERFVEIARPRTRLRVLEAGSGPPVLFIHGTVGPGGWPSLVAGLPGVRSLALDRPGWGRSTPVDFPRAGYRAFVADLVAATLDALGIERVDIVGGSIGDLWALSLAERHPDRVGRLVLLGGGPLIPTVGVPPFIRVVTSPLGAIIVRLPVSPDRARSILRGSGHGASLDAGTIPEAFVDWRVANDTDTSAMRHERSMARQVVSGSAYRPGITFDDDELRAIEAPVLLVYGTADPTGDADTWRAFAAALPKGSLEVIDGAGHMPWFDEPARVAALVGGFLAPPANETTPLGSAYAGRSRSAGPT